MAMTAAVKIKLAEIREVTTSLRRVHHELRHPYIEGCVECVMLKWLEDNGF